ncbi:GTPase IMAP family member 8-like [Sebastes umbrosus]|uniref:GTPase IMAP family member 8-like n=1 Tax=Sebastes umbrosus TaxID=72105 RepID=UPI0018A048DB|nr:GTPase IMAP family member 8-like [Sebastes umbrosus]
MDMSNTLRIVILGKTGAGKSSLANTIFGEKLFRVDHTVNSGTRECRAETKSVNGRSITLIDTPGFFDTYRSEEELKPEIVRCITECAPGPHVFLIVLKVEKVTEQEQAVINKIHQYFSEEVFKYATVVFTHGDQLFEGQTIEDFVRQNKLTSDLVNKCGGRCHVVDNKYWAKNQQDEYRTNQFQVEELLKRIDKTLLANNRSCYTNEMLQAVEKEIQKEKERIRQSSGNMSEEEIREQAKGRVSKRLSTKLAGIATGVLVGALLGVVLSGVVSSVPLTVFGAVVAAGAAIKCFTKYFKAEGEDTPEEAAKMEAVAVKYEAQSVLVEGDYVLYKWVSTIRIVVLGKTGAGKSSLANTIFGETVFKIDDSPNSGTSECKLETKCVNERSITWIDTPGFFDTEKSEEKIKPEIERCITECAPGPHAFLIVLKVEKFTEHEKDVIKKLQQCFSEEALKYSIVLFTHGDQLSETMRIEQWVDKNADLSDLVKRCGSRCHVIDNKYWKNNQQDEYRSNQFQATEILKTIDKMIEANQGSYYTNEMLQACERRIQQEEEHIRESSANMSQEEIRAQAKSRAQKHLFIVMAGVTTAALLGVYLGEKLIKDEKLRLKVALFAGRAAITAAADAV